MVKSKEQGSELFFVEVRDPGEVRKNILETLREILSVLQRFEKFSHIRHEKLERIQKLRVLVRQANKILNEMKSRLPQTNLRAVVVKEKPKHIAPAHHKKKKKGKEAQEVKQPKQEKQVKMPKKEMTEIEKLESELNAIEGKLKSLT